MNASPDTFRRYRLTVADYIAMGEAGIFAPDARVELIEGEIIEMAPIGPTHAGVVDQLNRMLGRAVGDLAIVRVQNPLELPPRSMPQPDLALLAPRDDFYKRVHPQAADTLLAIEVADSSPAYDLDVKMPLYARQGVPESWLIDIQGCRVVVHREPGEAGYGRAEALESLSAVSIDALEGVAMNLSSLFD